MLKGGGPKPEEPTRRMYYTSQLRSEKELRLVRKRLSEVGAWRIDTFYPDVIACELPVSVDPRSILGDTNVDVLAHDDIVHTSAAHLPRGVGRIRDARVIADVRAAESHHLPVEFPRLGVGDVGDVGESKAPAQPILERTVAQGDPLIYQNSEFLAGRILINVVFPESKGGENSQENWTQDVMEEIVEIDIKLAIEYWTRRLRNVPLDFDFHYVLAETEYEPITMMLSEGYRDTWMLDVMERLGYYGNDTYEEKIHRMNNYYRGFYTGADWVFTVFVVNAQNDPDHAFEGRANIHAELGGPYMVLPYPAGFFSGDFENWFVHCMTIVFWGMAEDEENRWSCGWGLYPYVESRMRRSGYLNYIHGNKVYLTDPITGSQVTCLTDIPEFCVAKFEDLWGLMMPVCDYTMGMLGAIDEDNDNVPDALDAAPAIVFSGDPVDTLVSMNQPVYFSAVAQAVPNRNSQQTGERRDYLMPIWKVDYSINNSVPLPVDPIDGEFDEMVEEFRATLSFMFPGYSTLSVTATNIHSAKSEPFTKQIYYIGLDYNSPYFELTEKGIGVRWLMRGETFDAEFELYRTDIETDSTVVVKEGFLPVGPKEHGNTPYYVHDTDVIPGRQYEYFVKGTFDHFYHGRDSTFTGVSGIWTETAAAPIPEGIISYPFPNPFIPAEGGKDLLVSVAIPGAEGIPMSFSKGNRSPAATAAGGPEPIGLTVGVYDVAGRRIKELFEDSVFDQKVNVWWDGTNDKGVPVTTGVYFIKAQVGDIKDTQKVLVFR
jgi:hypothetical protein